MNIIEVSNLKASYNMHTAIEDVNIKIKDGEYVCLVGENGSGKSTFIKTLLGIYPKDSGKIKINVLPHEVSYLEQNNMKDLNFPATAKEIIMTGLQTGKLKILYNRQDYEKMDEVSKKLGIEKILNKRIGDLSGGQRQRVMIARAIIGEPKLLILDEPCSGLDRKVTEDLYNILDKLHENDNITILLATHDIDDFRDKNVRIIYISKNIKFDDNIKEWKGI